MADWWSQSRIEPIQVYGPTMKTSSSPMTSGGSSSAHSTPASQILGNGSRSRAIIHASGVHRQISTARVTPPDSTDVSSGSRSPGPVSAAQMSPGDIRVMSVITGPSRATQMTSRADKRQGSGYRTDPGYPSSASAQAAAGWSGRELPRP